MPQATGGSSPADPLALALGQDAGGQCQGDPEQCGAHRRQSCFRRTERLGKRLPTARKKFLPSKWIGGDERDGA